VRVGHYACVVGRGVRDVRICSAAASVALAALAVGCGGARAQAGHKAQSSTITTSTSTASSSTTLSFDAQFRCLDAQRVQLTTLEEQLNNQLNEELAAHSPNAGATDASHQAVLRQIAAVNSRILRLQQGDPPEIECGDDVIRLPDPSSSSTTSP